MASLGMAFGFGLRANVMQIYKALADHYEKGDTVYLFGFSRGAFTIRVVAGLVYECGLPQPKDPRFDRIFRTAYRLYSNYLPNHPTRKSVQKYRSAIRARQCEIEFLGLFDTVKSYGGIWPTYLPHLRHNPIVHTVCHALARDERRAWFGPTTWGWLDSDRAKTYPDLTDPRYSRQRVTEMWFRGCHSDVGGGDDECETARLPLRWMLQKAYDCGLRFNPDGERERTAPDPKIESAIHPSFNWKWWLAECVPRWELDNSSRPAKYRFVLGQTGKRHLNLYRRGGRVLAYPADDVPCDKVASAQSTP